jgi:SNF2 family DNA or RNA helicase
MNEALLHHLRLPYRLCVLCEKPTIAGAPYCMHCGAGANRPKIAAADPPGSVPLLPAVPEIMPPGGTPPISWEIPESLRHTALLKRQKFIPADGFERRLASFLVSAPTADRIQLLSLGQIPIEPRPYQIDSAVSILESMRGSGILADEVGLGKTIEAGIVLKEMILRNTIRRVLILVPASLVFQWKQELEEKFGLDVSEPVSPDTLVEAEADGIHLLSLARAKSTKVQEALLRIPWDLVLVDEAHALKNHLTQSHRFVFSLKRKYTVLLTATPVQNDLRELYNLINIVSPGFFRSIRWFRRKFMVDRFTVREPEQLRAACARVMVRHRRADTLIQLPPRKVTNCVVTPTETETELFDLTMELARRTMASLAGEGEHTALLLSILLKESTSSPQALLATLESAVLPRAVRDRESLLLRRVIELGRQVKVTSKMRELVRQVMSDPEPIIVYTEYIETLRTLRDLLTGAGARVFVYSGQLRMREKAETLMAFRAQGGVLLSTEVGGQGLNLQHCHRMVNFDLPWNPMRLEQRIGRIHRFGQQEPVQITNITAAGTFEEVLMRVLLSKIRLFELVIGEIDSILAYLQDPVPLDQRIGRMILESPSMAVLTERMEQLAEEIQAASRAFSEDQIISARVLDLPAGTVTT